MLAIEYHCHFAHTLAFILLGGIMAASPWLLQQRDSTDWSALLMAGSLGYATHGVFEA